MKFTKFGKALLMSALSAGVVLGITSCIQSYSVGYLYVTGTVTAQSSGNGIVTGFKIDHNTGKLTAIHGLPISSGGANPVRAVLIASSRFLYVLNRGVTASGGSDCTTADPCQNSNITLFAVGGNGILTPQETVLHPGHQPLPHARRRSGHTFTCWTTTAPAANAFHPARRPEPQLRSCAGQRQSPSCGDITAFQVNQTTGRLSLVVNAQVSAASGTRR